jgi:hypothetical protein
MGLYRPRFDGYATWHDDDDTHGINLSCKMARQYRRLRQQIKIDIDRFIK